MNVLNNIQKIANQRSDWSKLSHTNSYDRIFELFQRDDALKIDNFSADGYDLSNSCSALLIKLYDIGSDSQESILNINQFLVENDVIDIKNELIKFKNFIETLDKVKLPECVFKMINLRNEQVLLLEKCFVINNNVG